MVAPRWLVPKHRAKPTITQLTPMMAMAAKLCIMVPSTFLVRVSPP